MNNEHPVQMSYAYDQCEEAAATLCDEAEEINCNKYIDDIKKKS